MTEPQQLPVKKSKNLYSCAQIVENQEWIQNRICTLFSEIIQKKSWMNVSRSHEFNKNSSSNSLQNIKCLLHLMIY